MIAESLERRARQFSRLDDVFRQQPTEIDGGAEEPFLADAHEIDATRRIILLEPRQDIAHGETIRHAPRYLGLFKRFGRGKKHRLGNAHRLAEKSRICGVFIHVVGVRK